MFLISFSLSEKNGLIKLECQRLALDYRNATDFNCKQRTLVRAVGSCGYLLPDYTQSPAQLGAVNSATGWSWRSCSSYSLTASLKGRQVASPLALGMVAPFLVGACGL